MTPSRKVNLFHVCNTPTLNSGTSGFSAAASSARDRIPRFHGIDDLVDPEAGGAVARIRLFVVSGFTDSNSSFVLRRSASCRRAPVA